MNASSEPFRAGETHTGFLDQHFKGWKPRADRVQSILIGWLADELEGGNSGLSSAGRGPAAPPDPFDTLGSWRMGQARAE